MYWKLSFGTQRLSVNSEFGGCPIFGSRKCTASTEIAVGTSTEVRYWEGPLSEVPLYIAAGGLHCLCKEGITMGQAQSPVEHQTLHEHQTT